MSLTPKVAVIGAGPAGLMAAEVIAGAGFNVTVFDAKPSACRKFLLAGTSGMNITHSEALADFLQRYDDKRPWLTSALTAFAPEKLRQWCAELGIETYVGSSGRVFTHEQKAAPLVRNWLKRLKSKGVDFAMRHRWLGWQQQALLFDTPQGVQHYQADATVLALGGASWPSLGSDGLWQNTLTAAGVALQPLQSANSGFAINWQPQMQKFAGQPVKNVIFSLTNVDGQRIRRRGECVISRRGMEGSLIYALSRDLRRLCDRDGGAVVSIDLMPDLTLPRLTEKLARRRSKESFSTYIKRCLNLTPAQLALLYECADKRSFDQPQALAASLKALVLRIDAPHPIAEAISSAGGVCQHSVDENFMLSAVPGVFCAGEMLDWEAPTGGYLLTACFATGVAAGNGVCRYLPQHSAAPC